MHRRSLLLFAMSAVALGPVARAAQEWTEGLHYFALPGPQRSVLPAGKIEVMEVFSYGCPACDTFEPVMKRLKAGLPPNAQITYLPASFNEAESWPMFQRAFFAAQALNAVERTHEAMYEAVWNDGELAVVDSATHRLKRPQPTIEDAARFYAKAAGVKEDKFLATANSFGVDSQMRGADDYIIKSKVDRTPTIIVNRKYRLHAQSAGGADQLIELVKHLVKKESAPAS